MYKPFTGPLYLLNKLVKLQYLDLRTIPPLQVERHRKVSLANGIINQLMEEGGLIEGGIINCPRHAMNS